jgi:hypothetical protein
MLEKQYRRKLSRTEANRHFVYIESHSDLFPPPEKIFKILVGKDKMEVKLDKRHRIWASIFWDCLPHFSEGDTIIFSKNNNRSFTVNVER